MDNVKKDTYVITLNSDSIATIIAGGQLKVKAGTPSNPIYIVLQPAPIGEY